MESIGNILGGMGLPEGTETDECTRQKKLVDCYNATEGTLHMLDGYECPKCKNKGEIATLVPDGRGGWVLSRYNCECRKVRNAIHRLKKSGLEQSMKRLKDFVVEQPWQEAMLAKAREYLAQDKGGSAWFYAGGAVGSGKTFICTGIARELLHAGKQVVYMPWVTEAARIKSLANEQEQDEALRLFRTCEVLYIDDFFKPTTLQSAPTGADVRIAYDIINYRYNNLLPTIISSEKYLTELLDIDEATGSRIYERCRGNYINVRRGEGRNYRMREEDELI